MGLFLERRKYILTVKWPIIMGIQAFKAQLNLFLKNGPKLKNQVHKNWTKCHVILWLTHSLPLVTFVDMSGTHTPLECHVLFEQPLIIQQVLFHNLEMMKSLNYLKICVTSFIVVTLYVFSVKLGQFSKLCNLWPLIVGLMDEKGFDVTRFGPRSPGNSISSLFFLTILQKSLTVFKKMENIF